MAFLSSLFLSAALFSSAGLAGGAAPAPQAPALPANLTTRTWVLTDLAPGGKLRRVTGERPTLTWTVQPGGLQLSGSTGCNTYRGPATVTGQQLKVSALATTRRGCAPTQAQQENDFLTLLRGASHYRLSGQTLTVYAASTARLVFTAAPGGSMTTPSNTPAGANTPTGTTLKAAQLAGDWQLTDLREGGQAVTLPADAPFTFTASGTNTLRLSGMAGCNRLMGEVTLSGAGLTFGPLAATRMACEDMTAEQALSRVLQGSGQVTLKGDTLTWHRSGGEVVLTRRAPAATTADLSGSYRLLSVNGTAADARRTVSLTFKAGQVGGFDGCNSFGGEYSLDKAGHLTAGNLVTTLRACPDQLDQPILTALLGQAPTVQLRGRTLTLDAGGERWVFERE
ncbi:META domain-containing protein [Deinococcus radiodurans]|jgi:Heat shock protein|nr:META domain-containing protein [Deinococcus radiodurans]QIP29878.1 META domain-containing protein [Deinococcus radiodurans]QIP31445.1 META domain-containing protein [Deinococcus radiodurans]UID70907.1 META domain-containing protein [Deinococcus radiodurans R1 = ATCC 13939 = DSM 20539]